MRGAWAPAATVFLASACIMILEFVAGRLIARTLGQSLYTWTSVIGVVLAGICAGNYIGGRLADRFDARRALSALLVLASLGCVLVPVMNRLVPLWSWPWRLSLPAQILVQVLLVFFLPSAVLGTVSPVVAKMALDRGRETGRTIGGIYAWGAAGSIVGTFLTGFWLIPAMGTTAVVFSVAVVLAVMGVLYAVRSWLPWFGLAAAVAAGGLALSPSEGWAAWGRQLRLRDHVDAALVYQDESQYSFIAVSRYPGRETLRVLVLDKLLHNFIDVSNPLNLVYDYLWIYEAVVNKWAAAGRPVTAFFIGGGGYAFPQYLELTRPGSRIDVAEIDPAVTRAAFAACGLRAGTAIRTFPMDARNYVTRRIRDNLRGEQVLRYDLVLGDSFNDFSVPYQLTTEEFVREAASLLNEDGVYIVNLVDTLSSARLLGAMVNTCRQVFPHVVVFACKNKPDVRQTFVAACSRRPLAAGRALNRLLAAHPEFEGRLLSSDEVQRIVQRTGNRILTDDHAPVENLLANVVRQSRDDPAVKYAKRGLARARRGRYEQALADAGEALRLDPQCQLAHYAAGATLMKQGLYGAAVDAFTRALEIDPEDERTRGDLVIAWGQLGPHEKALRKGVRALFQPPPAPSPSPSAP